MASMKKPAAATKNVAEVDAEVLDVATETPLMKKPAAAAKNVAQDDVEALDVTTDILDVAMEAPLMKKPAAAAKTIAQDDAEALEVTTEIPDVATEAHVMKKPAATKEKLPKSLKRAKKASRSFEPPEENTESRPMKKARRQSKQRDTAPTTEESQPQAEENLAAPEDLTEEKLQPDSFRKRPLSPTFAFINEKRDEIAALIGSKNVAQIAKKGTELFNALPPSEREARKQIYDEEQKAYKEWQGTEDGKAAMMAKRAALKNKRATKKNRKQGKPRIGALALATAEKRRASGPSTPMKRKVGGPLTPLKGRRILSESEKEEQAEKRREKILMGLRKEVLGAISPRQRALALAREAIAKGTIKPSWLGRNTLPAEPAQTLDQGIDADAEGAAQ